MLKIMSYSSTSTIKNNEKMKKIMTHPSIFFVVCIGRCVASSWNFLPKALLRSCWMKSIKIQNCSNWSWLDETWMYGYDVETKAQSSNGCFLKSQNLKIIDQMWRFCWLFSSVSIVWVLATRSYSQCVPVESFPFAWSNLKKTPEFGVKQLMPIAPQ